MSTRGKWYANSAPAAATAAVAVQVAAPNSATELINCNRCQTLTVTVAGDGTNATGAMLAVLRDGATGVGSILWEGLLAGTATGSGHIELQDIDFRASPGNALTLEFTTAPPNSCKCSASMAGDIVVQGQTG